jgi:proline dehydrogenase
MSRRVLRHTLLALSRSGRARRLVTGSRLFRPTVRRFIAGETLDEALAAVAGLNARGLLATLDVLGEATVTEEGARAAAGAYAEVLAAIAARGLQTNVSLKLSQLGLDIAASLAEDLLAGIAAQAHGLGNFVRVDMEDSPRLPATLEVFDRVWARGQRNIGIVLQAYLYRTPQDVDRYIGRGVSVRLCKGAYDEPPAVAFPQKRDVDRQFALLAERLLRGGGPAAIATHDERLIAQIQAVAAAHAVPRSRFEFQMLHGIRRDLQERLVRQGYRVRVYVPFGLHWYPYFMRRLAERPANVLFLARNLIRA